MENRSNNAVVRPGNQSPRDHDKGHGSPMFRATVMPATKPAEIGDINQWLETINRSYVRPWQQRAHALMPAKCSTLFEFGEFARAQ